MWNDLAFVKKFNELHKAASRLVCRRLVLSRNLGCHLQPIDIRQCDICFPFDLQKCFLDTANRLELILEFAGIIPLLVAHIGFSKRNDLRG
ncbi:hypothetical protein D3C84_897770 [compost metagenome]